LAVPIATSQIVSSTTFTMSVAIVPQSDYVTDKITAAVSWGSGLLLRQVSLSTYTANFKHAANPDTCYSSLPGEWGGMRIQNSQTNFAQLIGAAAATYAITSLDALRNRLYVGATTNTAASSTLFIFDSTNPAALKLLGSVDTTGLSVSSGAAALIVATSSAGSYAFVANAYAANFATCKPKPTDRTGGNCAELQIFDVSNPALPTLVSNYELPTTTALAHVTGTGSTAGNAIFYDNGFIYLGLTKTTTGPEFNIIDVHNPFKPQWVGGYSVGYVVNAIYEKDNIAYIAHPTDSSASTQEQVTVLDVTDKTNPVRLGGYKAPDKQGNGKSIFMIGDSLYLGRTVNTTASNNDFYILNASVPAQLATLNANTPQPQGKKINSSVNATIVRDNLAFLLTGTSGSAGSLYAYDIHTPTAIATTSSVSLPNASSGVALDCEGSVLFAASNDASGKGYLSVIYP